MNHSDDDSLRFWIHFVCGALLGAFIGFLCWMRSWEPGLLPWLWIGGFSLAVALMGGIFGDRFWEWFLRTLRWW